jgi:ABC-type lipoprotein export system ATPase subunit
MQNDTLRNTTHTLRKRYDSILRYSVTSYTNGEFHGNAACCHDIIVKTEYVTVYRPFLHRDLSPTCAQRITAAMVVPETSYVAEKDHSVSMDEKGVSLDLDVESGLQDDIPLKLNSVSLEWVNISYSIPAQKKSEAKTLIHPMSGHIAPGEMLAIMGTSGAGKSTLLDILAGRLISNNVTGQILTNQKAVDFSTFRKQSAYVMQSDALFPLLTVKETLYYAAHLGIQGKTYAEREAAALKTMKLLGLEHVKDTIVGDNLNRGLSGGEKRRVSIAVDIIHEPSVIFLDEPTSGTVHRSNYNLIFLFKNHLSCCQTAHTRLHLSNISRIRHK